MTTIKIDEDAFNLLRVEKDRIKKTGRPGVTYSDVIREIIKERRKEDVT